MQFKQYIEMYGMQWLATTAAVLCPTIDGKEREGKGGVREGIRVEGEEGKGREGKGGKYKRGMTETPINQRKNTKKKRHKPQQSAKGEGMEKLWLGSV